ncbi:MAG: efflux RND transporter permease subunit, partial [Pirellulales bacterium]|nr:efflux RND transporter permease subunit [Pirellulales bacterium]
MRHLAIPLFGSTLTTALAFGPIALMPGPAGEFVGSIAISVILAIVSSLFLALTVVPALTAMARKVTARYGSRSGGTRWWREGVRYQRLSETYRRTLDRIFARPWIGLIFGVTLPAIGFLQFHKLPEQFFPPADRDQFQIELERPSTSSMEETLRTVQAMRQHALQHDAVEDVSWFLGESAPSFYYNIIPRRRNTSSYAQALVQLKRGQTALPVIRELQEELDAAFPDSRVLVRQLEQGPPFDAPVELRLYGPDLRVLGELGDQVRVNLSRAANVIHTRSDLSETVPKLSLRVDEEEARLAGLNHTMIANQLNATLEGVVGGSILEETEELPVRVRVADADRARMESIASLELRSATGSPQPASTGVPVSALGKVNLTPP